jgi:hypothetical protein
MGGERPVFDLADDAQSHPVPAPWAGGYLALGARLARYADRLDDRQLVVVLSVPRRDFVAALVGAGWALTRPPTIGAGDPANVTAAGGTGLWYRAVNSSYVYNGKLSAIDVTANPPRIRFAGSNYRVDGFQRMAMSESLDEDIRQERPVPGSITRFSGADREWDDRLVAPAQDLALVGIETRLRSDLEAILMRSGETDGESLEALLLPWGRKAATWFSRIHSSASLDAFPIGYKGVILDGQGAIKFIEEILSPVVVCIVDRSVADETQVVNLVNKRITEGAAVSSSAALEWRPPAGVEVMVFEVRL